MRRSTRPTAKRGERMAEVKKMRGQGMRVREIAAYLGISRQAVYQTLERIRGGVEKR